MRKAAVSRATHLSFVLFFFVPQIWTEVRNSSIKESDLSDSTYGNIWIIGFRCYAVTYTLCRVRFVGWRFSGHWEHFGTFANALEQQWTWHLWRKVLVDQQLATWICRAMPRSSGQSLRSILHCPIKFLFVDLEFVSYCKCQQLSNLLKLCLSIALFVHLSLSIV